jgi:hypothetical protein
LLFIAGTTIRRITPDGIVRAVFAEGGANPVEGALAIDSNAGDLPRALAVASDGTLYFARNFTTVWKVTPDGRLHRVAGHNGTVASTGDDGAALDATFSTIWGLALDGDCCVVVADQYFVRRIGSNGIIIHVAGRATDTTPVDGDPAASAWLGSVTALAVGRPPASG